jgi:hypothetical protein
MRKLVAAVLFMVAGALLLLAGLALSNVWEPLADSSDSAYVETAAIWAALAVPALAGGIWTLRSG